MNFPNHAINGGKLENYFIAKSNIHAFDSFFSYYRNLDSYGNLRILTLK